MGIDPDTYTEGLIQAGVVQALSRHRPQRHTGRRLVVYGPPARQGEATPTAQPQIEGLTWITSALPQGRPPQEEPREKARRLAQAQGWLTVKAIANAGISHRQARVLLPEIGNDLGWQLWSVPGVRGHVWSATQEGAQEAREARKRMGLQRAEITKENPELTLNASRARAPVLEAFNVSSDLSPDLPPDFFLASPLLEPDEEPLSVETEGRAQGWITDDDPVMGTVWGEELEIEGLTAEEGLAIMDVEDDAGWAEQRGALEVQREEEQAAQESRRWAQSMAWLDYVRLHRESRLEALERIYREKLADRRISEEEELISSPVEQEWEVYLRWDGEPYTPLPGEEESMRYPLWALKSLEEKELNVGLPDGERAALRHPPSEERDKASWGYRWRQPTGEGPSTQPGC